MSETQIIPVYRRQRHTIQYYIEGLSNLGIKDIKLKMVEIPPGRFVMGASETEAESTDDEHPQHIVAAMPQIERELKSKPSRFNRNMCT